VVVDVWLSAQTVLEADIQVVPKKAILHHVPHDSDPVLDLYRRESSTPSISQSNQVTSNGKQTNDPLADKWRFLTKHVGI
jgi:hypothetical protein